MNYGLNAGQLHFMISADARDVRWEADGLPLSASPSADFWRVQLDDGEYKDIPIHSRDQIGAISEVDGGLDIAYQQLYGPGGRLFAIQLTVHIRVHDDQFLFSATIKNDDESRVNEMKLPFVDVAVIADEQRSNDILYRSQFLGERMTDPWTNLDSAHSEYMAADYHEIWLSQTYPSFSSMGWLGVQSGGHFLYMGQHDDMFRSCVLAVGKGPRNTPPRLILSISHFPLVQKGETEFIACSVVALPAGDWRQGSAIYRHWAEQSWWTVPQRPEWVTDFTGWQRIILKHQYGEILFRYDDLPRVYEEGKKVGLNMLLVFGWWKGRFDNSYPLYEPDPALGGEEGLRKAIAEVQRQGGRVALYTNGVLIDIKSDFYKTKGYRVCRKDIDGNEYREHYQFSDDGMLLRNFGYKSFVSACQATPEWKEQLLAVGRQKLSYNADSVFFDQVGGHFPRPCFDESHEHGTRGDREAIWRRENMQAIRQLCTGDKAFGTEFVVDCFAPFVDYHHGLGGGWCSDNSFPEMYRHTFPETIMTNRLIHDERHDYQRELNFAFAYGYRFDVGIYRCRGSIGDAPAYGAHIAALLKLREQYKEFFYEGMFTAETDVDLPKGIVKTEYKHDSRHLFVFWNDSPAEISFTFNNKTFTLAANALACEVVSSIDLKGKVCEHV